MNGTQAYILSRKQLSLLGTAAYLDAGVANGVATLDDAGKVPSMQLPSYVDDVLEYDTMADFPPVGESGKIYVDKSTNKSYRWSGSTYIFSGSDLALGETSTTAYRGDRGKAAYDHSLVTSGNPHNVTKGDLGLGNVENKSSATIRSELTKSNVTTALGYTPPTTNTTYTITTGDSNGQIKVTPSSGNAYNINVKGLGSLAYKDSLSKSDVGLGNVENKSSATIRSELTKSNVTTALGYTPPTTDTNTTYTIASGDSNGQIKVTPSSGNAYNVNVKGLGSLAYKNSLSYSDVGAAPVSHTHDDRYYTESEVNSLLSGKSDTGHAHDERYYTESEVNNLLAYKSDVGHTHAYVPLSGAAMNDGAVLQFYHDNVQRVKISDSIQFFPSTPAPGSSDAYLINSTNSSAHLDINADQVNFYQRNNQGTTTTKTMIKLFGSGGANNMTTNIRTDRHYLNLRASVAVQCVTNDDDNSWIDLNCKNVHENSSRRYKTNIKDLTEEEALKVLQLRPVTFTYKHGEGGQRGL